MPTSCPTVAIGFSHHTAACLAAAAFPIASRSAQSPLIADAAGFNVETIEYKNLRLTVWDVGGQHQASA